MWIGPQCKAGVLSVDLFLNVSRGFTLALMLAASATAQEVGKVTAVEVTALQAPPQAAPAELQRLSPIFRLATLTTNSSGKLEVTFTDDSKFAMVGNATAVIDDYVLPSSGGAGAQSLRLVKGFFRLISGTMPKDRVRVETPTAGIGIRGTILRIAVEDDGTTTVGSDDGTVIVTSNTTGASVTLTPGEKVTLKPGGEFSQLQLGKVEGCD